MAKIKTKVLNLERDNNSFQAIIKNYEDSKEEVSEIIILLYIYDIYDDRNNNFSGICFLIFIIFLLINGFLIKVYFELFSP